MKQFSLMFVILFVAARILVAGDDTIWMTNHAKAFAKARETGRPVLMDFTGSDWCPPCKVLEAKVFSTKEFKDYSDKHLVLLRLDYPIRSTQSEELEAANLAMAEKFKAEIFPTLIVVDADQNEKGRIEGYAGQTVDEYLTFFKTPARAAKVEE